MPYYYNFNTFETEFHYVALGRLIILIFLMQNEQILF